jgi:hypothetical protein
MNALIRRPYPNACPSDLKLDLRIGGALPAEDQAAVDQHLQICLACAARLNQHEAFRTTFQAAPPPMRQRRVDAPPAGRRLRWWPVALGSGAVAAVATLALMLVPGWLTPTTRLKGGPHLGYFVEREGRPERGADGAILGPGTRVQFVTSHSGRHWLAVLGRDVSGQVSVYFPEGTQAAERAGGTDQPLPVSTILDDSLGPEEIFAVFCDRPLPVAEARAMVTAGIMPSPPRSCRIARLAWDKRRPPRPAARPVP